MGQTQTQEKIESVRNNTCDVLSLNDNISDDIWEIIVKLIERNKVATQIATQIEAVRNNACENRLREINKLVTRNKIAAQIESVRNNTCGSKLSIHGTNISSNFKKEIDQLVKSDRSALVKEARRDTSPSVDTRLNDLDEELRSWLTERRLLRSSIEMAFMDLGILTLTDLECSAQHTVFFQHLLDDKGVKLVEILMLMKYLE
eukprot:gene8775-1150_t